jgi:hypothetical protein
MVTAHGESGQFHTPQAKAQKTLASFIPHAVAVGQHIVFAPANHTPRFPLPEATALPN